MHNLSKYRLGPGLVVSTFIALAIIPVRLSEGQGKNPLNLIGSEIVIWLLWFSCWLGIHFIQQKSRLNSWQKVVLSVLLCVVFSIVFYHISNPFFEDFPLAPIRKNSFWVGLLRLSIRGLLVSVTEIPFVFYIERAQKLHDEKIEIKKQHARDLERRNQLLEQTVAERTRDIQAMVSDLNAANKQQDNQIYLLSRLFASITHDIQAPLSHVLFVSRHINKLVQQDKVEQLPAYIQGLETSLESMVQYLRNLLEFIKIQIKNEAVHLNWISLPALISEKADLFAGINKSKNNSFMSAVQKQIYVHTNHHLFGIVLHNLLDNAAKYTDNGEIHTYLEQDGSQQYFVIENSGDSIPPYMLAWLNGENNDMHQLEKGPDQSMGIGLILVQQITALLNIKFFIRIRNGNTAAFLGLEIKQEQG